MEDREERLHCGVVLHVERVLGHHVFERTNGGVLPGIDHIGPRAGEHTRHIGPRAGEHKRRIGLRAGEHTRRIGPRAGGFDQSLAPRTAWCPRGSRTS